MAPCVVRPGKHCLQQKSAGRLMGACGWCTQRVSATVETAGYANSVSGMAGTPRNHVGEVGCFIPSRLARLPCVFRDWSRRQHRRACMQLLRHQRVDVHLEPLDQPGPAPSPPILSRAQRAHYRLSWEERFARNKAASTIGRCTITLFGVPESFAASLGLLTA
jgi:hypothetical protein